MEELRTQSQQLQKLWKVVYDDALVNPTTWAPHVEAVSLDTLDEIVRVVVHWFDRSRAPAGFAPGFTLAKTMAAVYFPQLLSTLKQLKARQYNHLPNFVSYLTNVLSVLHTMAAYSPKEDVNQANADLSVDLAQALALVGAAHNRLQKDQAYLKSVLALCSDIEEKHTALTALEGTAAKHAQQVAEQLEAASAASKEADESRKSAKSAADKVAEIVAENKKLKDELDRSAQVLIELQEENIKQSNTINAILPKAAAAGLADAFMQRRKELGATKWMWFGLFAVSLVLLALLANNILEQRISGTLDFLLYMMSRMPLAAPVVWLGWVSAIQYGNTIRVQEDYAFKEATSKAYQGYRDHMEHLADVDAAEASTALNLLSTRTIEILSREPLRIYGKTHRDATPASAVGALLGIGKRADSKPEATSEGV